MTDLELTQVPAGTAGMGIRRPPQAVFRAFADPAITTRFWFTKSSGELRPGATVRWDWEMYGASARVVVKEFEDDRRIVFDWGEGEKLTTVELRFVPWGDAGSYVDVTETGFSGGGDEVAARAAGSTAGFTIALCALKALLEHDVELGAVRDRFPHGL
jgi:uncharacterized protein YndB with AHSA1/START domain